MKKTQFLKALGIVFCLFALSAVSIALAEKDAVAYAGSWAELQEAAENKADIVIITADIAYGENEDTVVFQKPVTIQSAEGGQFTLDGGGKQIICIQGKDKGTPFRGLSVVKDLTFQNGDATENHADVYKKGYGGALFVHGSLEAENCVFTDNTADSGGAVFASKSAVFTG